MYSSHPVQTTRITSIQLRACAHGWMNDAASAGVGEIRKVLWRRRLACWSSGTLTARRAGSCGSVVVLQALVRRAEAELRVQIAPPVTPTCSPQRLHGGGIGGGGGGGWERREMEQMVLRAVLDHRDDVRALLLLLWLWLVVVVL